MSMIHDITARAPRYKRPLRKGRGESSGHGKTAGRGTKGSGAHGGDIHWKPGHEGGQTPLHRRLPTRGFSNARWAREWYTVNIGDIAALFPAGATVDAVALADRKLIPDTRLPVKILGDGAVGHSLTVTAGWYSKSAVAKITAAGGSALNAEGKPFEFPKPRKRFVPRPKEAGSAKAAKAKPAAPAAAGAPADVAAAPAPAPEAPPTA
jgi:large subunit ribosomal protein L15